MAKKTTKQDILFEVSWEVCNKVGGIYTVIHSKLPFIKEFYNDYVLIGPALAKEKRDFKEKQAPPEWEQIFRKLKGRGVTCYYGVWNAQSSPTVVLVDFSKLLSKKDEIKKLYWEKYAIDSIRAGWMYDEPICFATAAGMVVEEYVAHTGTKAISQWHEWMAGVGILHLKAAGVKVGTVFTTHATMLGRTLSGNGYPLYDMLENLDAKEWAYKLNVEDKHLTEVACAHAADAFTTVSEITGKEAEKILGRKPDVLLFNGFYNDQFPTFEDTSLRHKENNDLISEFLTYFFFPYYQFDLDKTLVLFTSGRYEFQNKGDDIIVEALAKLNNRLKEEGSDVTIAMFFWLLDMGRGGIRRDLLEHKNVYSQVKSYVNWHSRQLIQKTTLDLFSGHSPTTEEGTFTNEVMKTLQANIVPLRKSGLPPLATHDLVNEGKDPLVASCRVHGLLNRAEDKVKVIIYPGFLDSSDGLLSLDYYNATAGAHLGIFPSQYEPWGYTPLESGMVGVPCITTDLAGFGRYIRDCGDKRESGIYVIEREGRPREEVIERLAERMYYFINLSRTERVQEDFTAKERADTCTWPNFIDRYVQAHNLAAKRGLQ